MQKKKSLGQHFLHNRHYLNLVADAADIAKGDTVVEIGPGEGALTEALLARGAHVIALEKDSRLIGFLRQKFKGKKFEVVEGDALLFDISNGFSKAQKYKAVGNVPYYITGALFKKFLSAAHQPSTLVFLVQKEVAERIVGNPEQRRGTRSKKESILSLSVKAYGAPRYIKTVPAGAFSPPPKVNSAIVLVSNISRKNFKNKKHEEQFFELVRAGFAGKRKQLGNNLKHLLGPDYSIVLQNNGISPATRAEDVPLAAWLKLTEN